MNDDPDLPDEIREENPLEDAAEEFKDMQRLSSLVAGKRDAAVKARKESGIEDIWTYCEEAYAGIDDLNRKSGESQQWRKPTSPAGGLTKDRGGSSDGTRSTVFVRLTSRYVDMAAAKLKEKALPIDDKPFSLEPSPVPSGVSEQPAAVPPAMPAMPTGPAAPGMPPQQPPQPPQDPQKAALAKASKAAEKASKRIYDWLAEAKYSIHIKQMIDDAARIGTGILKGPFPGTRKNRKFANGKLTMETKTVPDCTCIDPWNFFPSGNCGENIQDGDGCFERSFLSESKLSDLKLLTVPGKLPDTTEPVYLLAQIDKVLEEGPEKCKLSSDRTEQHKKSMYTLWHYHGQLSRKDMIRLRAVGADELPDEVVTCHAVVTLINDTVIRAQISPLEQSGNLPYHVFRWSRRANSWTGVGPGEQIMVPQAMVNAGTRGWMNNAGVSSGAQIVIDDANLAPEDGSMTIGGGMKLWVTTAEGSGKDVRTLMNVVTIPNLGAELKAIIDYAFKLAEEMSNIPLISQGQTSANDPQTFGQAELQNNNANTLMRQQAENLDGSVIEPLIGDYYEWLLLDTEVPDDEKEDFQVIAQGCSAMVEKAIQEQTLLMMGQMTLNPAFGWSPASWAEEFARAKRLDPEKLKPTEAERQAAANAQPPKPPVVTVAEIREQGATERHKQAQQTAVEIAKSRDALIQKKSELDVDRDAAYVMAQTDRSVADAQAHMEELMLKRELALLDYANKRDINLNDAKKDLAINAMKLNLQRELSGSDGQGPQVVTPAIEPAGRAPDGRAFQR